MIKKTRARLKEDLNHAWRGDQTTTVLIRDLKKVLKKFEELECSYDRLLNKLVEDYENQSRNY